VVVVVVVAVVVVVVVVVVGCVARAVTAAPTTNSDTQRKNVNKNRLGRSCQAPINKVAKLQLETIPQKNKPRRRRN
jgi:septation ring formation regulator EzrA